MRALLRNLACGVGLVRGTCFARTSPRAMRLATVVFSASALASATAQVGSGLAVVDAALHRVVGLSAMTGEVVADVVPADATHLDGGFACVLGPSITVGGVAHPRTLLVSDLKNRRVVAFDLDNGAYVSAFIENIDAYAFAVMPDKKLLVACGTGGVRLYNTNGTLSQTLIAADAVAGPNNARGVLVRPTGNSGQPDILIADATLDAIYRFSAAGARLGVFAKLPQFRFVEQIAFRSTGNILAADPFAGRVFELDAGGVIVRQFVATRPRGVVELLSGDVLVSGEDGVQVFNGQSTALKSTVVPGFPTSAVRLIASLGQRCTSAYVLGDMNVDGQVDFFDIEPFVLALSDPAAYATKYPTSDRECVGDINSDGTTNMHDIQPFVELLMRP